MGGIYVIANQKGGVGKTTTAVNLATALAATERSVLLIDLDPQGNASTGLGVSPKNRAHNSYDLLIGQTAAAQALRSTIVPHLDIIPSNVDLSAAEIELVDMHERHLVLKRALGDVCENYEYVIIDCPPSLGLLTLNALCASNKVLVPLQCEFYSLEGLSHLIKTIRRVKQKLNPALELQGVVLTMVDRRNKLSRQVEEDVREFLGDVVYDTVIPRNIRISEAPSHGKPALLYDFNSIGARAYIYLARELIKKERLAQKLAQETLEEVA